MNLFYGTGVAIVTPFQENGQVDYDGLRKLINYLISGKVEYLVVLGTTGESTSLTREEKRQIFEFAAAEAKGRIPLVAGIGGNNTYDVTEQIKDFNTNGYSAILSSSPAYNKPSQEGIYQHYKAISESSPLPVILYNVPGRTASNINAATTVRLARDFTNIIGIKDASGNFDQFNEILRDKPEEFLLISGDDPVTLPMIAMGAAGVISVIGNALPQILSDMVRLCLQNNFKEAQKLHNRLIDFTRLMFTEGNPAGVKAALMSIGICADHLRLPLVPVSDITAGKIAAETKKLTS